MTIGERIRKIRTKKNLTQKQLGDLCNMADSAIRRYESDKGNPTLDTLKRIADALGVPVYHLIESAEYSDSALVDDLDQALLRMVRAYAKSYGYTSDAAFYDAILSKKIFLAMFSDDIDKKMIEAYDMLNHLGKEKAFERIAELTEVPKYQAGQHLITLTIPGNNGES